MRRRKERGQALILVVLAIGVVLAGAMGLAVDSGRLYGHRQMAQAAADAAAQAAILTVFNGTVTSATLNTSAYTCTNGTDTTTPCKYAFKNGFGADSSSQDAIGISYPTSVAGVSNLASDYSPNAVTVSISRPVPSTFLRLFNPTSTTTVSASATAAILSDTSTASIVILHPTLTQALMVRDANTNIIITGGPQLAVQVNSSNAAAFYANANSTVDLSRAGPDGTGADFGSLGGPGTYGSWLLLGSTGMFRQPNPIVQDPFRSFPAPTSPGTGNPGSIDTTSAATYGNGLADCPCAAARARNCANAAAGDCTIYHPGYYDGTTLSLGAIGGYAIFEPGLYWVNSGGFQASPGGNPYLYMCGQGSVVGAAGGTCAAVPSWDTTGCCSTNNGMMVYLNAGSISIGSNANAVLTGADVTSPYKDILFFGNRSTTAQTHTLIGGGTLRLTGSLYFTNCTTTPCNLSTTYQTVKFGGNSGSTTTISGEIITDNLILRGGGTINMFLNPLSTVIYDYVALVK